MTAHGLGLRRLDLYLQHDRPLTDEELVQLRELLRRRGTGEPVAQILGHREFYGHTIAVTRDVLVPRPETELVMERSLHHARGRAGPTGEGLLVADLGTGSGAIACALALELPGVRVIAVDLSRAALTVAMRNAVALGVAARVEFVEGSWWTPLQGQAVDIAVTNPPYIRRDEIADLDKDVRLFEPHLALDGGDDGLDAVRAIAAGLRTGLRPDGVIVMEVDSRRAAASAAALSAELPGATVAIYNDLAGHERVVEVTRG